MAGRGAVFVFQQELQVREGRGVPGGSHLLAQFDSQPCYVGQERRSCRWQISDDVSESELGSLQQLSVEGTRTHGGCANSHPIIQRSCLALLQVGLCECRKALFEELSFRGLRYY